MKQQRAATAVPMMPVLRSRSSVMSVLFGFPMPRGAPPAVPGNGESRIFFPGVASGFREDPEAAVQAVTLVPPGSPRELLTVQVADGDGRRWTFSRRQRFGASTQEPGVWTFGARRGRWSVSGRFSASLQKVLGFTYDDPLGTQRACHHSGVADATLEIWRHGLGKKRLEHTLTARSTAAFEQGALKGFDHVRFFV